MHILDRFHIVAKLNKAIDEVRAGEHRQMQQDGYEPVLKHSRWCLLKHWENLTEKQELKLRELLQYNLKSVRAYLLKEDFNGLWEIGKLDESSGSTQWPALSIPRVCLSNPAFDLEPTHQLPHQ